MPLVTSALVEAFAGTLRWLDRATGPTTGQAATIRGEGKSPRATGDARAAVAVFCRILAGPASDGEQVRKATGLVLQRLPAGAKVGTTV